MCSLKAEKKYLLIQATLDTFLFKRSRSHKYGAIETLANIVQYEKGIFLAPLFDKIAAFLFSPSTTTAVSK